MNALRYRNAYSRPRGLAVLVAGLALIMVLGVSTNQPIATPSEGATPDLPPRMHSLQELWWNGDSKRMDKGVVDVFGVNPNLPEAWVYVVDSTLDGNGTEYWIFHSSYVGPSPTNDGLTFTFDYVEGADPQTLQECLDLIVATNSHVSDASELEVHKHTATLIQ